MRLLTRLLAPKSVAHAHCDLPCGVYDPAQALIEAQSVKAIAEKYAANEDPAFRARAHLHQGAALRARQAPPVGAVDGLLQAAALREVPAAATRCSTRPPSWPGAGGTKGSVDVETADKLLAKIEEISKIFWETKQ